MGQYGTALLGGVVAEVEEKLTIHHLPLLVQPASGRVVPPLQHHVVALQAASEVVPGRGDHGIFALQVLDDLLQGSLLGC